MTLSTSPNPPYQMLQGTRLGGLSVDILACVFARSRQHYTIDLLPWARAVEAIKQGESDGVFTTIAMPELDKVARLSDPLALEKWYWFHRADTDLNNIQRLRIAGIRGSNELQWLRANGYPVSMQVNTLQQLVYLLKNHRIDLFLADKKTVENKLQKLDWHASTFRADFSAYRPLGVYFSNRFLNRNTGFLHTFNQEISPCLKQPMALDDAEQIKVKRWLSESLLPRLPMDDIRRALRHYNAEYESLSVAERDQADQQWVRDYALIRNGEAAAGSRLAEVSSRDLSARLAQIQAGTGHIVSELFVTGKTGISVAHSAPTSDFYHGDERPFTDVMSQPEGRYIGPIQYDASSQRFQVKVGLRIDDTTTSETQGVIFVGIDVEQALKGSH